jgi:RNA polymerase sigma factor (sigma-70 family)
VLMTADVGTIVDVGSTFDPGVIVAVRELEDARDRDLLRRLSGGEEEAFVALFRRYAPAAKALATRIIRQSYMAEEIVQDAFLSLWKDPGSYREERGTVRSWLLSAVHHRAVDRVRREEAEHRRRSQSFDPPPPEDSDPGETVVERVDAADQRARVRSALQDIPEEQREVLERMYFDGKTQSAIADELGLPLGTVKSRTLLGMRRLRGMLLDRGR